MSFKECSCGKVWRTRNDLLADPDVELVGYQTNFKDLEAGLFLFNHLAPKCETTIAIAAGMFTDLHKGPIFKERRTGSKDCRGYCLKRKSLAGCLAQCECAYVRDVLVRVKRWKKSA
jgi:hypothetical protein